MGIAFGGDDLGMGGLADMDVTIVNPRFVIHVYRKKDGTIAVDRDGNEMTPQPMAHIPFRTAEGEINEYTYLPLGSTGSFRPEGTDGSLGSEGPTLEVVPKDEGGVGQVKVSRKSQFGFFMWHLNELGYFKNTENIGDLDGLKGHLAEVSKPGSEKKALVFVSVEKDSVGSGSGAKKAKGKGKAKKKDDSNAFNDTELETLIVSALVGADNNRLSKTEIMTGHLSGRDRKWQNEAVSRLMNGPFTDDDGRPWTCEDNVLTLKEV